MKKRICLLLVLFAVINVFADEYVISKIKYYDGDYYTRELSLKYSDKNDEYYLFRSTYSRSYWYTLTSDSLDKLRNNLAKTKEWEQLAKANKSTITKELPDSVIEVEGTMKSGSEWYFTSSDIPLSFHFMSNIADDHESVALYLLGGEKGTTKNKYITIEFESMLIVDSQIDDFINAISEETINEAKLKHEKEKNTADLFN